MDFKKYVRELPGRENDIQQKAGSEARFYLQGLRNVGEIVEDIEEKRPISSRQDPRVSGKSMLQGLLNDARMGHKDFIPPEKLKRSHRENAHYECSPVQSAKPPALPSLQALQYLTTALQDRTIFKGVPTNNAHRAPQTHRPEKNDVDSPTMHVASAYHVESTASFKNIRTYCQVSLCPHEHFCIDWYVSDPGNEKGSWIASIRHYWDHTSSREDHRTCKAPDSRARCNLLAQRIIEQFVKTEQGKLTNKDKRNGAAARRPPAFATVEREVRLMYSHTFRGNTDKIVEEKEAIARKNQDRTASRRRLAENLQLQALQERQGRKKSGQDLDSDASKNNQPVEVHSKKRTRLDDDEVYSSPNVAPKKKQKSSTLATVRVQPMTMDEHEEHTSHTVARPTENPSDRGRNASRSKAHRTARRRHPARTDIPRA